MNEENITYAKGRIVELSEEIATLQTQTKHAQKSICSLTCKDEIHIKEVRALLDDYEVKSIKLSKTFEKMYIIQDKWGLRPIR